MSRKFFCFARRSEVEAGGNAQKENIASYGVNWVGLSPAGRQSKVSIRIFLKIGSDFVQNCKIAEAGGFEPPRGFYPQLVFKTSAINHSATPPKLTLIIQTKSLFSNFSFLFLWFIISLCRKILSQ